MIIIKNPIVLKCRQNSCCPVLEQTGKGDIRLSDDYGGSAILTQEQFLLLYAEMTTLIANQENH